MKKVIIFAGNHRQFTDFVRTHRFLNISNAEYCSQEHNLHGLGSIENPIGYILTGEYWLNPAYRSHYHTSIEDLGRIFELKNDKEVCKYLDIEWIPEDLGIKIDEITNTQDGLV